MAFNPFKDGGATEVVEDFDPFKDGGATKVVEEFDPFKNGGATELDSPEPTQNYFVDKTKRLGQSLAQVPGQFVESVGQMADATGRALAVVGADELNALQDSPTDARLAAFNQALRTPTPGTALIRDTGREMRQNARDLYKGNYAPDPARDAELGSKVAGSTGSLVASLITPGGLVAKTTTGALVNSLGQSDEARQKMLQRGATEQDADDEGLRQFVLNLPAGALEAVPWEAALKRFGGTKIADAVAQKYGKTALRRISTAVFGQAATEAGEEALQNLWGNAAAKLTYDPTRAVTEGTGEAALVGGLMGGGFGGTAQTTAEIASALDTRQNLAESKKTLLAQQQQLVRGLRSAQMFPVDAEGKVTNELPLPPEMARVATERGVFHYNPAQIDEATLLKLSGVGRENGPLGLGSQSKADVAARVAQGDPAVTVTERQPDGTEVKASVATLGTANQTAAQLAASKTPGNTVQVESLGQVVAKRSAAAAPNFIEGLLAADAAAATATRETAAKEEAARTARQTELADKKARFEERLAVARQTLADPAASFPAVDGALTSLTSYAEDRSIGLTQTQREHTLAAQAALQKRHALLAPDAAAAADAAAATRRTEAKLAEDVKTEKVRRERAKLQHLETTGRDLATGEITDLTNVPDEELATLDANAEGLTPAQIDAEQQRRGEQAERTAATANDAGYTLRDLIFGKKAALAAAGQRSALRLKSPAALSLEGGTMAGEHRALGERQGGFKIFSDTGLAEDGLQERLQSLGFDAPDVTAAYALYERALAGEEIRPERGSAQQVDFAAPTATPGPILTETQIAEEFAALRREFPALTRDLDLRSGLVAYELQARGYTGPVPPGVQAAILKLQQEKRLLVIAAKAAREGKASGLFLHEMAHPFFDALPPETKTILRELHAQEMATATGPLFNADGQLLTDVNVRAADFPASRLRADPDLPVKEWFAERVRALNTDWLAGRTPRDHSTMLRVWRELLAKLRAIFAQVRGLDPDSDLFTTTFRRWLDLGGRADLTAAGLAYATRQEAEFASRQKTATANLADPAPLTDFRDAEEQRAYLANPDNFNDRPYPGVVKGTPLWNESQATAEKSLELDTERRRRKLTFAEIETIARRATGKPWTDFQNVADYDRTLAELRQPGSQVGKFPGGQTEIQFASRQDTMDLGSTPLGVTLPNEIRNLAPRWQDKTLQFDSSLDKALYYAGGTPGALRERIIDDLGQQTGLSAGEIATLARELRQRLAPVARPTASNATVRVPAQMQSAVRMLRGVDFATGAATRATVSKVSKKNDYLRVGTSRLGTDAVPLTTPATSNIHGKMVPAELLAKQMPYVNYPHLPQDIRGEQNPVVKRDKFVAWMKDNLLALYRAFPADVRARATQWYNGANTIATDFSVRFNTTVQQASGVLAVLSPQKDWFMNVAQAEQVMDIWKNHQNTVITEQLVREQLEDIISGAVATPGSKRTGQPDESPLAQTRRRNANARLDQAAKDARRKVLQRIIGKTVQQLEAKPRLQGWAIRVLAQSIHGREFRIISPEGNAMGVVTKKNGESRKNVWGSIEEIEKAVSILKNGSLTNISDNLGNQHKVRNFYNNIVAPNTPFGDATMDTHAVAAAHIMPFGASALEVKHNFGTGVPGSGPLGVSGIYHLYIDAYTDAAKELGLLPRQLQSITWEAIRQLYPSESRRDKNVIAAATAKWKNNTNGSARTKLLRNGISRPAWARATNDEQPQGRPTKIRRRRDADDTRGGLRFRGRDGAGGGLDQAGPSVDFATANSASEYVAANGTPPAKVAAARADIERILGVAEDDQLDFVSYTRGGRLVLRSGPSAAGLPSGRPAGVLGAAEALKAPDQPDVVRAAYGIDPADPSNTGSERISSIIPTLIADPKRTWDIRGAQITTARDVMTLVTVLRSPYVETAKIILLNRAGVVVHSEIIAIGSLAAAIVDPNQLAGVLNRAPQTDEGYDVILSHNHPGGNPAPSPGDYKVTRALRGLLSRTKHNLRDHVVTNGDTYYSYAENKWPVPSARDRRTGQPLPPWYAMGAPSAVTTQPPTARGADADTRIEPGTAAPWEIVRRNDLYSVSTAAGTRQLIDSLRQVDPTALHIIYLNTKYLVTALERVPNFKAAAATQAGWRPWEPLTSKLLEGFGREGAAAFMLFAPDTMTSREAKNLMLEMAELSERSDFIFLDYAAKQLTVDTTARGLGLMEPGPSVDFATGAQADTPVFYSRLTRTVEQSPQGRASGAQWKATIRNSKLGVNQDEFALVGVGDLEDGKTYTKTEVLDYLRANEVKVQDVTLGAPENAVPPFVAPEPLTELPGYYKIVYDDRTSYDLRYGVVLSNDFNGPFLGRGYATEERAKAGFLEILNADLRADAMADWEGTTAPAMDAETQFARWQLPGAVEGSYREVLLTLPEKIAGEKTQKQVADFSAKMAEKYKTDDWWFQATEAEQAEHNSLFVDERFTTGKGGWRDGHGAYSEHANPIVRLRYNEHTTADGKRMLFLEEVQPPLGDTWHEVGGVKFEGSNTFDRATAYAKEHGGTVEKKMSGEFSKMPALFQQHWSEIAFKWAMRKASDEGFDSVGWTTGEQQAARYDLSKQVDTVRYNPRMQTLLALKNGEALMDEVVPPEKIADHVGKDIAQKLLAAPLLDDGGTWGDGTPSQVYFLRGNELKIGGEGLKKLYDVDFRNVVNNLPVVRKSGQKVGMAKLPGIGRRPLNNKPGSIEMITAEAVHAFTITPEIRAAAMQGQAQFATGPDSTARLADVEQRLAALSNSQEDPADLAARSRALTAERDQLQREIAAATREAQAAKATIDVRHPAAVAIPSEPGDAWAMAPQMTDGELAAERDSITQHIHDQGDGLAPAMRAHLNARLNALSTEQHRRGTPLGTAVVALPQIDRQAALVAELTRGRALAADGNRTGNDAALNEGNRLVRLAKARLDEEFPGWDATPAPATKAAATQPPLPPEPPTAEAAPASEGDGEQSPFSGSEEETMPVRPGKWSEVYGHSSYTPSFLLKTWRRIAAVLTGIRGPIPELPTFPAARWNKSDPFIAEHGPQFYARIAEGERALKSANDYLQRTAADQIGAIIEPLLKAEGKFSAEDYAQLRRFQEQARRTQAEGKPLPPSLTAGIAALNSKMESSPYVLFNRLVFALDLHWRVQNLKDSAGNAIVLPAGINAAETKAELARLSALLAASPHAALIQTAITAHRALVAQVAEDLKSRELLAADHLANPYYFPHLTLETTQGGKIEQRELTPARVRPGTEADFRGYLETPVGSKKAIEQDYVRAMYYHLVQVGAHNFKADAVRDYFRPYDIKATVERRAKELTKERGVPVTWEQAFNEEFAPRGYVKYGTDSRDAFPTLTINRDLLARRLGVMLTSGDLHAQLKKLNQTGVKLLPEDIRESLTQGERETWIVPSRVAEALRGIGDRLSAQDNAVEAALKWTLQVWKSWKLFMPMSHIRYEYGNIVADSEKLFSGSPGTFKYLPIAAKELRAFWLGGKPSTDLQAALKDGVLNAITAQELDSLVRIKAFEAFETRSQKAWDMVKRRGSSILYQPATAALGLGEFSTPELSALREAITRYAHYQANLEAIRAGARPAYGGAYWRTIEAMTDSRPGANDAAERKAAAISKATFGDYGDLSVLGQTARDKFIPFYSWMEINFRYHANLLRNLRDMVREGDTPAAAQAGKAVALAGLSFTARAAGGLALRLALPYLALALWNNSGDRDELEKLLSEEDRRRTHLIIGRDAQGKVLVVYGNTALMDVMKWISGPKFAQAMGGWLNGKTDFATAAATWRDAILPDLANNTAGSFGPYFKIPYTLASGKAVFPDITDQKTIPAYDMRRAIIGQITDDFTADLIERTVNKDYYGSKDLGDWAKQLIMQVRQRDPESWAFYSIKDKANDYLEKRTGTKRDSSLDAPDQQVLRNFRRAIYRGDVEKAVQFYQRLLDYGYTAERFQASIRSQDPLSALPKENGLRKQFVDSLNPDDRAQLDRAYVFYQRMNASRGQERQLFPSQSSGFNGQMRYQAQPRTDLLRAQMQRVDGMTDEEREQRAQRDERRSLQRTN